MISEKKKFQFQYKTKLKEVSELNNKMKNTKGREIKLRLHAFAWKDRKIKLRLHAFNTIHIEDGNEGRKIKLHLHALL